MAVVGPFFKNKQSAIALSLFPNWFKADGTKSSLPKVNQEHFHRIIHSWEEASQLGQNDGLSCCNNPWNIQPTIVCAKVCTNWDQRFKSHPSSKLFGTFLLPIVILWIDRGIVVRLICLLLRWYEFDSWWSLKFLSVKMW